MLGYENSIHIMPGVKVQPIQPWFNIKLIKSASKVVFKAQSAQHTRELKSMAKLLNSLHCGGSFREHFICWKQGFIAMLLESIDSKSGCFNGTRRLFPYDWGIFSPRDQKTLRKEINNSPLKTLIYLGLKLSHYRLHKSPVPISSLINMKKNFRVDLLMKS